MKNPFKIRVSTITSSLVRLAKKGYIIRSEQYEIEDHFFEKWIFKKVVMLN